MVQPPRIYLGPGHSNFKRKPPSPPVGGSAVLGSFVASEGVAEEARTRGFAAPAFAGCAFIASAARVGCGTRPVNSSEFNSGGGSLSPQFKA
jgi:hypothetical protein